MSGKASSRSHIHTTLEKTREPLGLEWYVQRFVKVWSSAFLMHFVGEIWVVFLQFDHYGVKKKSINYWGGLVQMHAFSVSLACQCQHSSASRPGWLLLDTESYIPHINLQSKPLIPGAAPQNTPILYCWFSPVTKVKKLNLQSQCFTFTFPCQHCSASPSSPLWMCVDVSIFVRDDNMTDTTDP